MVQHTDVVTEVFLKPSRTEDAVLQGPSPHEGSPVAPLGGLGGTEAIAHESSLGQAP